MSPPQSGWPLCRCQSFGIHTRCVLLLAAGQATSNVKQVVLSSGVSHLHCLKEVHIVQRLPTGVGHGHRLKEVHVNHWCTIAYRNTLFHREM